MTTLWNNKLYHYGNILYTAKLSAVFLSRYYSLGVLPVFLKQLQFNEIRDIGGHLLNISSVLWCKHSTVESASNLSCIYVFLLFRLFFYRSYCLFTYLLFTVFSFCWCFYFFHLLCCCNAVNFAIVILIKDYFIVWNMLCCIQLSPETLFFQ